MPFLRLNLRAAPGAVGELGRRAAAADRARPAVLAVLALERVVALLGAIGRGALADPEANAERRATPALRVLAADDLTGADQGGGALELLEVSRRRV